MARAGLCKPSAPLSGPPVSSQRQVPERAHEPLLAPAAPRSSCSAQPLRSRACSPPSSPPRLQPPAAGRPAPSAGAEAARPSRRQQRRRRPPSRSRIRWSPRSTASRSGCRSSRSPSRRCRHNIATCRCRRCSPALLDRIVDSKLVVPGGQEEQGRPTIPPSRSAWPSSRTRCCRTSGCQREVAASVTAEKLQQRYEERLKSMPAEEEVHARHILVVDRG